MVSAGGLPAEVLEGGRRAEVLEEVLRVWGGVQTDAAWVADLPAEVCQVEEPSVGRQCLVVTSGRPLEEGWAYP